MTLKKSTIEIAEPSKTPELQYQRQLAPIEITDIYPSDQGSADLTTIGSGRNGKDYAIKKISDGNGMIPVTEFFCYELARKVNIATPEFDILLLPDDELAFGSVWEGGVHKISGINTIVDILNDGAINGVEIKAIDKFFGKVYAFDLFINNVDRHFGNFLFRQSYNNTYIALAFDYSRAWLEIDFKGTQALDKLCNTQVIINHIKNYKKFNRKQSEETLIALGEIESSTVAQILSEVPNEWISTHQRDEVIKWWGSQEFIDRLQILKTEINNVLV
ncbi:MAG: hypothetical protein NTV00_10345 [Methylococcales bacterium]|nr:hypothetical protein [Methylococcales bacterium]